MVAEDQKFQRKVARRKEKVERMLREHQADFDGLDPEQEDYYRMRRSVQAKIYRLEQELRFLEEGRLPGAWG